jgi:hypothetical protein
VTEVFLHRSFDPPLTEDAFYETLREVTGCFDLYRVQWRQSLLSTDGRRMICWLSAPDAESTRLVHDSPAADAPPADAANVVVERSFDEPVTIEEIQAIEDAGASCLETHQVTFVRTFFSRDRRRMICLYRAPDAEAVRMAQRKAGMSVDSVWSFRLISR